MPMNNFPTNPSLDYKLNKNSKQIYKAKSSTLNQRLWHKGPSLYIFS